MENEQKTDINYKKLGEHPLQDIHASIVEEDIQKQQKSRGKLVVKIIAGLVGLCCCCCILCCCVFCLFWVCMAFYGN